MNTKNDISTKNIMTEYIDLTNEYQKKYGKKTIILLQVGAFFEVYGLKNINGDITESQIEEFSQICQLNISEKKITYQDKQVVMAGFRDYTLEKYLQKLTDNDYTAVVYIQEKDGKNVSRVFHGIYSPGTYISYETDIPSQITNHIMCIWIDKYKPFDHKSQIYHLKDTIICGVATVNIFTGESFIFEYETTFIMNPTTFDELERYITVYNPSEILFLSPFDDKVNNNILQYSGVKTNSIHKYNTNDQTNEKVLNCYKTKIYKSYIKLFFWRRINKYLQ